MTRFIGRFERLSSPIRVEENLCPARTPDIRRIVVPEFPQSRGWEGAFKTPSELTIKVVSSRNCASTPRALQISREERGS